jgi:hypothetical protein
MSVLREFQAWYAAQCDGDWEHSYGAAVSTLDNPGWRVVIDLTGTALAGKDFTEIRYGFNDEDAPTLRFDSAGRILVDDPGFVAFCQREDDPDWLICSVNPSRFEGCGGPDKLEEILAVFLRWHLVKKRAPIIRPSQSFEPSRRKPGVRCL